MDSNTVAVVVAVLAAIIAPLLAYLTASRRLSGKIGTSDADKLWDEAERQRVDYRERITQSDIRVAALESRVEKLEERNHSLRMENFEYERTIRDLRARLDHLEEENVTLRARVAELTDELHDKGVIDNA